MTATHLSYSERANQCQAPLAKQLLQLLDRKKTNLALSADVGSADELLHLADTLGPEICVLKTHIDIIKDFTPALTQTLSQLAQQHQFLLFEDRKFADIGNTVKQQYAGGLYRIADWADIVNAHSLPGPGIIEGLASIGRSKQRGLLLLAEMSSNGHLFNQAYIDSTLAMAEQCRDFVIGFITQHAISPHPYWINMTPGIHMSASGDALQQQYISPETAILENGTDIIIVGRGIISASNPLESAKDYRFCGWDAYQKRQTIVTMHK